MKRKYTTIPFGEKENRLCVVLYKKPMQYGLVGMVRGKSLDCVLPILMDTTPPEQMEYEHAALLSPGNGIGIIQMAPSMIHGIRRGDVMARTCLFHELGHFVRKHLSEEGFQTEDYDRERRRLTQAGGLMRQELEADAFAAEYLGSQTVAKGLAMIRDIHSDKLYNPSYDPDSVKLSMQELENRIKVLTVSNRAN